MYECNFSIIPRLPPQSILHNILIVMTICIMFRDVELDAIESDTCKYRRH